MARFTETTVGDMIVGQNVIVPSEGAGGSHSGILAKIAKPGPYSGDYRRVTLRHWNGTEQTIGTRVGYRGYVRQD